MGRPVEGDICGRPRWPGGGGIGLPLGDMGRLWGGGAGRPPGPAGPPGLGVPCGGRGGAPVSPARAAGTSAGRGGARAGGRGGGAGRGGGGAAVAASGEEPGC